MRTVESIYKHLHLQSATMRALAAGPHAVRSRVAPRVSAWSSAHHIDHSLKVATAVLEAISQGSPLPRRINPLGRLILLFGWIPRGRGKSPKQVVGVAASGAELCALLDTIDQRLARVKAASLADVPVVPHPYFGGLSAAQALRFVYIHTRHHLRIIADIDRASGDALRSS